MELIKKLGTRSINGRLESYAIFWCAECKQEVMRNLSAGKKQKSCGCVTGKLIAEANSKHGESKTRLYIIWNGIIGRCFNPKNFSYENYGGRGITICPEWTESYIVFRDWSLSNGYKENLQINRIKNDGNYEPSNCEWTTRIKNMRSRRNNVIKNMEQANEIRIKYNSEYYTQRQLSEEYNVVQQHISDIINNKTWKK